VNFVEVIAKKRDGRELNEDDVRAFVGGAARGTLGDEQLAALLMAICIRGASTRETTLLVEAMRDSGACWRLGDAYPEAVDKHSTGGVGDSVSLIFAPLVAACGVPVTMMAGAGLGHTQGTLDKLASIQGFRAAGNREEAIARIERCGVCFAAQSQEIAPADRKLYALRDVTATVPSSALIVASIMSKKLAVGTKRLILDVKWGTGAFCKKLAEAEELAEALVSVAASAGVMTSALVTDMNEPLGNCLGSAAEVRAAVEVLEGRGDRRLTELTMALAAEALVMAGRPADEAATALRAAIEGGAARHKLDELVLAHGGRPEFTHLPRPSRTVTVTAPRAGVVRAVDGEALGWVAVSLGAGRRRQGDEVDPAAGLVVHARTGDRLLAGAPLATLEIGARDVSLDPLLDRLTQAFELGDEAPQARPLVVARFKGNL